MPSWTVAAERAGNTHSCGRIQWLGSPRRTLGFWQAASGERILPNRQRTGQTEQRFRRYEYCGREMDGSASLRMRRDLPGFLYRNTYGHPIEH